MKPSLCRLLLVAALSLFSGTLPAKTLNVLLLANASTQDVIQKLIREYQQQNPDTDFNFSIAICLAIAHSLPLGTKSSACRSKPRLTGFSTTKSFSRRREFKFRETR